MTACAYAKHANADDLRSRPNKVAQINVCTLNIPTFILPDWVLVDQMVELSDAKSGALTPAHVAEGVASPNYVYPIPCRHVAALLSEEEEPLVGEGAEEPAVMAEGAARAIA